MKLCDNSIYNSLRGKKCDVLGLGISNIPLIRFLHKAGAYVTARDKKSVDALGEIGKELEGLGVKLVCGDNYPEGLTGDFIFRSPGIRPDTKEISDAVKRGAKLSSEIELFLSLTPTKVFALTGSDGKTTSTTLTSLLLKQEYEGTDTHIYLGGNIGTPPISLIEDMTDKDITVLELSSFQLMTVSYPFARAAITNVSPNHLNWHTSMDEYVDAKKRIIADPSTETVLNASIADFRDGAALFSAKGMEMPSDRKRYTFESGAIYRIESGNREKIIDREDIRLPGVHNVENYMTAIAMTDGYVSKESILKVAREFGGVEHRLELVRVIDGVKCYNGSIDSSPTRTAAALSALDGNTVVICGGYDKNLDYAPLADALIRRARAVVLTGQTKAKIMNALNADPRFESCGLIVKICDEFEDAVNTARDLAKTGDNLLLSPASASFDRFKNFEERGKCFKSIVNAWTER